jgi:hypothetical protein
MVVGTGAESDLPMSVTNTRYALSRQFAGALGVLATGGEHLEDYTASQPRPT